MAVSRVDVIDAAQGIAQDPAGSSTLLLGTNDYDLAIDQALDRLRVDRPNLRIVHYTVSAAGFRFVLFGTGVILPTTGLDRWVDGGSSVQAVYQPYDVTSRENEPIDRNEWRVRREPGPLVVLELLSITPASGVLRLEYWTPHVVDATDATKTSVLEADEKALEVLTAAKICEATARRYVQNTGTSAFQSESVDRRSQSDVMAARAKELTKQYEILVGIGAGAGAGDAGSGVAAAATIRKMTIATQHNRPRLWHDE